MDSEKPNKVVPLFGGELSVERDPVEELSTLAIQAVQKNEGNARELLGICEGLDHESAKIIIKTCADLLDTGKTFPEIQGILAHLAKRSREVNKKKGGGSRGF